MSLANCENKPKGLIKKPYAQIFLKLRIKQDEPIAIFKNEIDQMKVCNNIQQKIKLADQNSEISILFSKASSRQSMRSKKQKYRRSLYKSNQKNEMLSNFACKSPKKVQKNIKDQHSKEDNSIISKGLSVMECSIEDSHILLKKAFQNKQSKILKSNSKQKFRKSRGMSNPRYSISQSNVSVQFDKWIAKHISLDSNDSFFNENTNKTNQFAKKENQILQSGLNTVNKNQTNSYMQYKKDLDNSYKMINENSALDYSNIQQFGSQCLMNDIQEQQDLEKIFGFDQQKNKQKNKVTPERFIAKWQQNSAFIQKKLFAIKQDTYQNDTSSTHSQGQQRCKTKSQIICNLKKAISEKKETYDFKKKKGDQNNKDKQIQKVINQNENLKRQFEKFKNEYEAKRIKKQAKKQVKNKKKEQPQCVIM